MAGHRHPIPFAPGEQTWWLSYTGAVIAYRLPEIEALFAAVEAADDSVAFEALDTIFALILPLDGRTKADLDLTVHAGRFLVDLIKRDAGRDLFRTWPARRAEGATVAELVDDMDALLGYLRMPSPILLNWLVHECLADGQAKQRRGRLRRRPGRFIRVGGATLLPGKRKTPYPLVTAAFYRRYAKREPLKTIARDDAVWRWFSRKSLGDKRRTATYESAAAALRRHFKKLRRLLLID